MMASSSHLKPGEKGRITARIATLQKKGPVVETIDVRSNDPKRPGILVTLQAQISENTLPFLPQGICR